MLDDAVGPRDVSGLQLPLLGHVDRDERGAWQVFGADGEPMSPMTWFLDDLSASDCADSAASTRTKDSCLRSSCTSPRPGRDPCPHQVCSPEADPFAGAPARHCHQRACCGCVTVLPSAGRVRW